MKPVRCAFIGAGEVANRHAEGVGACPAASLVGIWNRTRSRAEEKAARFDCQVYDTPAALVADANVDAVFVLTDLNTHYEYARLALEAGKHVLIEKPVDMNEANLRALRDLATSKKLHCFPGHNYIYDPGVRRIRDMIDTDRLGRIVAVHVLYNIAHPEAIAARYPGVIQQIMTHHAYILLYLAGRPVRLSGMKASLHYEKLTREDIAFVNLELASGALAHFVASFAADDHTSDPWTMMIKVLGTAGGARYSYRDWVEYHQPGEAHSQAYTAYPLSIHQEVEYFVNRCIGAGEPPLSTMEDALDACRIVGAIERAAHTGDTISL
jgi:predicted dehydrogenase